MNTYGNTWFRAKKCLATEWTREQARACHTERRGYAVQINCESEAKAVVEFDFPIIKVSHLDGLGRIYLFYAFRCGEGKDMFLFQASYYQFAGDSDTVVVQEKYLFDTEGEAHITVIDKREGTKQILDKKIDVSANRMQVPDFDHYDNILEVELVR